MPKARILVADDSCAVRTVVTRALNNADYDVSVARDGQEAVLLAQHNLPDLAILDIHMPGMDGYAACQEILDLSGRSAKLPIVFLTNETAPHLRALGADLGAYLPKPVNDETLISTINELLEITGSNLCLAGGCK